MNRARLCFALLFVVMTPFAASASCSSTPTIDPSEFDNTCSADGDCVVVDLPQDCCFGCGNDAINKIADMRGVPMAQIALAWVLSKPVVSCPIVGATKPKHLQDAVAALDVKLTDDETTALEDPYTAQDNYWW